MGEGGRGRKRGRILGKDFGVRGKREPRINQNTNNQTKDKEMLNKKKTYK